MKVIGNGRRNRMEKNRFHKELDVDYFIASNAVDGVLARGVYPRNPRFDVELYKEYHAQIEHADKMFGGAVSRPRVSRRNLRMLADHIIADQREICTECHNCGDDDD